MFSSYLHLLKNIPSLYHILGGQPKSLKDLLKKNRLPIHGYFDRKFGTAFNVDGRMFDLEQFGRIKLLKTYTEKFLKGNFIKNGRPSCFSYVLLVLLFKQYI